MAVRCPAGEAVSIRFDYHTPGLSGGALISLGALALLLLYLLLLGMWDRRTARKHATSSAPSISLDGSLDGPLSENSGEAAPPPSPVPLDDGLLGVADGAPARNDGEDDGFDLYRYYPTHKEETMPSGEDGSTEE